jgi:putative hydrolase
MDPVEALTEIAYLLERERASKFKAKAFRKAADVVAALPDEHARDLGRIRSTPGIGDSTFGVIRDALEGRVPTYLAELREHAGIAPQASGLRQKLTGDLHAHTEWSDGTTSIESMVAAGTALGHEYLALTDHSPRLRIANGLSAERLDEQLAVLAGLEPGSMRVLSGIEVDILENGELDQTPEMLDRLDVVVASVHSKLALDARAMTKRMIAAVSDPHTNVLGHVTGRLVEGSRGTRAQSQFDARAVFEACAEHGVAVEVNSRPERQDPPDELIAVALDAGCLFSIDSDAHAPGQLSLLDYGAARAEAAGIPAERIVTTWSVERLLEWTRSSARG